ncbi:uncharacterized protein G2W53_022008 [Senna tora]|uniref:Uncharacterized protein n=1 Tax=Senna tora TaxID=362788 RepID=A0A834WNU1_9FABA|nr:uncharacterized protein G2W53_022008 [Senna tora]
MSEVRRLGLYLRTVVDFMFQLESSRHASEGNTPVRVVFANRSGYDVPIRVIKAWEERGSCLSRFRMIKRGRISETFTNYEGKDLLRKKLHELRGKRLVAQVSETHRFALHMRTGADLMLKLESSCHGRSSGFDAGIGFFKAWEERGSCLNIFWTTNCGRILEIFMNYEAKDLLRKHGRTVDHVLTYSGRQILVRTSRITRQKTCCASEWNTSVRVIFANRSGFHIPIGVVKAWEERGSFLNIFRRKNRGRIVEIFSNYEAKDLLRN